MFVQPLKLHQSDTTNFMNDFYEAARYCPFDIESKTQVKITKIHNTEYSFPS